MPAPESSLLSRLASNLRAMRARRGLTREELAETTDVDPQVIKRIEGGRANPTLVMLSRLASALTISLSMLLSEAVAAEATFDTTTSESEVLDSDVVGETLAALRKQRHVSRRGLARLVDIRTATLQRYENGETDARVLAIEPIAQALAIDSVELVRAIEQRQRHADVATSGWNEHAPGVQFRLVSTSGTAELWEWRLDGEATLQEPPAVALTAEIATAIRGTIAVEIGDARHVLRRGGSVAVPPDQARVFVNTGKSAARLLRYQVRT